jgi:channel protein (hemolysin III family)
MLVGIVWAIALLGIIFTLVFWGKLKALHVLLYLAMGWLIVFFWKDIVPFLPEGLLGWVIAAGLTYSIGSSSMQASASPTIMPFGICSASEEAHSSFSAT